MTKYVYRHRKTGHEITIETDAGLVTAARALTKAAGKNSLDYELEEEID